MSRRLDLLAVVAVAAVAAVAFAPTLGAGLNYDEAVYLASADALLHGQALGQDVYASQPPGWYAVVEAALSLAGRSVDGVRALLLVLPVAGCLAAYAIGRAYGGVLAGLAAGLTLTLAPPWPEFAGRIEADPGSVALGLASLAAALWSSRAPERWATWLAAAAGALLAAALSLKLLAVPFAIALVAVAIADRVPLRRVAVAAAAAAAVTLVVLLPHVSALGELRESVLGFHADARAVETVGPSSLDRVLDFPHPRTPFTWIALAGAVAGVVAVVRTRRLERWPLWTLAAAATAFVLWVEPLQDHHLVLLAAGWGVPAATELGLAIEGLGGRARPLVAGVLALFLAAAFVQEHRRLAGAEPERDDVRAAADIVRGATAGDALVAADLPQVAFYADRRVPGALVDASAVRFQAGSLTPADVRETIADPRVAAVVVGREFRELDEIRGAAADRFPRRRTSGEVTVYVR